MNLEQILLAIYQKLCDIESSLTDLSELGSISMQMMDIVSDLSDVSKDVRQISFSLNTSSRW